MENSVNRSGSIPGKNSGIVLSPSEAEEYCEFKRQKRIAEVVTALTKSELYAAGRDIFPAEIKKIADSAKRVGSAAVRVSPMYVPFLRGALQGSPCAVDCVVGGTGETTAKVKGYEAKLAMRGGAKEITLVLSYSALKSGRTGDTKREIKKVCRSARRALVKVEAEKTLTYAEILRVGRFAADCGAKYLTVEFFPDCGRLKRDLHDSCMLEVTGVETAADYKALVAAGVERIGTSHAEEIYAELMKEAENCSFAVPFAEPVTVLPQSGATPPSAPVAPVVPAAKEETAEKTESAAQEAERENAQTSAETKTPRESKAHKEEKTKAEQMSVLSDKKMLGGTLLK